MEDIIKYDGIILDIDGTIWNTTGIVAVAWNRAIDMSGFNARKVVAQDLQKEFGKTMDKIAESLWPDLNADERAILIHMNRTIITPTVVTMECKCIIGMASRN